MRRLYWVGIRRIGRRIRWIRIWRSSATGGIEHFERRPLHDFASSDRDMTGAVGDQLAGLVAIIGSGIGRVVNAA